jgi:cAMP phosphodiesterase
MKIKVLGGHGGLAKGFETTSILIDNVLLVDAGSVASHLSIEQQTKIENILISHCHLDHTKDLAFICDNCFGLRPKPFQVHTHATVSKIIKEHLLNNIVWPDFTALPNITNPTMVINSINPEEVLHLGDFKVTPIRVNHPHDAMGFIIEKGSSAVLFSLDTGPTDRIWEIAHQTKNLKAIFTEISFPNELQKVADLSAHHTPFSMTKEILKMPKNIPIIFSHLKPNYRQDILKQIKEMGEARISVLEKDGEVFHF